VLEDKMIFSQKRKLFCLISWASFSEAFDKSKQVGRDPPAKNEQDLG
jgi:hypothetical protein